MTLLIFGVPFRGAKEIHCLTLQALVEVSSLQVSFVVHLDIAIGNC